MNRRLFYLQLFGVGVLLQLWPVHFENIPVPVDGDLNLH